MAGPSRVEFSALAITKTHIQQAPTLFLGAAGGGVWTSVTFTGTSPYYAPVTDNFSITDSNTGLGVGAIDVGAIAVDPNDTIGTIYVGTGEANYSYDSRYGTGILKSTDGGDTFQLVATGTAANPQAFFRHAFSRIIVDPRDTSHLYAAVVPVPGDAGGFGGRIKAPNPNADDGIYRSNDGGTTWTKLTSDAVDGNGHPIGIGNLITVTDMDYTWNSAAGTLTLYAGVRSTGGANEPGGIWQSTDSGNTWVHIGIPAANGGVGRIVTGAGALNPADVQRIAFSASHATGRTDAYAIIIKQDGTLLDVVKTVTNDGQDWTGFGPANFTGDQGWYDVAIGLSPTDRLYVAGQDKVFESTNMATWRDITVDGSGHRPHADAHAFAFTQDGKVYLGTDGGLWRYNPATGAVGTWDDLNAHQLQTHQLLGIALNGNGRNTLLEGSQDNGVARTTDGGTTWMWTVGGDGGLVGFDGMVGFATANAPKFSRSADAGASQPWVDVTPNDPNGWPFIPVMAQHQLNGSFIVLGSTGSVWETQSGGVATLSGPSWVQIGPNLDPGHDVTALGYGPPQVTAGQYSVYAGFDDGRIFRMDRNSPDFVPGTWTELAHPWGTRPVSDIAAQPDGSGVVYVNIGAFNNDSSFGQVFRSSAYGASWLDITGNLPKVPANTIVLDQPSTGGAFTPYVGNDDGVYVGVPNAFTFTWARFDQGLPHVQVSDLQLRNYSGTRVLAAGTHGRGAWTISLPTGPVAVADAPNAGPTGGGTTVTVTGSGFLGATGVTFGGLSASFTVNSDTSITAVTPGHPAGPVNLIVTTPYGTSQPLTFTYMVRPQVTGISPTAGPTAGGTSVLITGSGFLGATAVTFGALSASFTVNSDTQITATSPASASAGLVDVTVQTPGGTSATSASDQFTYQLNAGGAGPVRVSSVQGSGASGTSGFDQTSVAILSPGGEVPQTAPTAGPAAVLSGGGQTSDPPWDRSHRLGRGALLDVAWTLLSSSARRHKTLDQLFAPFVASEGEPLALA